MSNNNTKKNIIAWLSLVMLIMIFSDTFPKLPANVLKSSALKGPSAF